MVCIGRSTLVGGRPMFAKAGYCSKAETAVRGPSVFRQYMMIGTFDYFKKSLGWFTCPRKFEV